MNDFSDKLNKKHIELLNKSVQNAITSLYSWALIIRKDIQTYNALGVNHDFDKLDQICSWVEDYVINDDLPELEIKRSETTSKSKTVSEKVTEPTTTDTYTSKPTTTDKVETKPTTTDKVETNTTDKVETKPTTTDKVETKTTDTTENKSDNNTETEKLRQQLEHVLSDDEQKELDDMILDRKQKMVKEDVVPSAPIKFNLSVDGIDDNDSALCTSQCGSELSNRVNEQLTVEQRPDNVRQFLTVAEMEQNGIPVNALTRISPSEREKLEYDLFVQAKKNVKSLMPNETNEEVLEPLYFREADRLLQLYMETH